MFSKILKVAALALATVSAQQSPCPSQQKTLQASASEWPKPTGDLSSYISSYSTAHSGVFSNCQDFTSPMPTSLSSPYQAWVTSVEDWSVSFESTVSAAASTCLALVANVVIPLPRCPANGVAAGGSSASATGSSSTSASSTPTGSSGGATSGASGTALLVQSYNAISFAVMACAGAIGTLALVL